MYIYERLASKVSDWRASNYAHPHYPAIAEILEWCANPETAEFRLRLPQIRALETYWYLRLVENTPHILSLYETLYTSTSERMAALGLDHPDLHHLALDHGYQGLLESLCTDDELVKRFKLEALRESLTLEYPSYILALAMGAGKTVLIGAIYASEFALAQEYPDERFVQNALVFAPGKTIIESLRELAEMRYNAILPPRLYKWFAASVKLTFTRDGDPTIPIIPGSLYNVVVTNTEKIRIQKENIRKSDLGPLFSKRQEDEARAEVANLRLQAIASLPNLAIFSDEAHHTYGQAMDRDLKKVRKTVDYLYNPHPSETAERQAHDSNLICVVNTTGTPYYQRQPLRDVVIWYGLSDGIHDGILKEVSGNIRAYDFEGSEEAYLDHVVQTFFEDYGDVSLPDGTPAKLAVFFPQTDDVSRLRPLIERRLVALGYSPTLVLEHHTRHEEKERFDRFFRSQDRLALLVDRGVEGWNVPALFACALARRLKSSNNFVLQAASRCLRQVPGNRQLARIYLSIDNRDILDRQLQETYGETVEGLNRLQTRSRRETITLRKVDIPPLVLRRLVSAVVRLEQGESTLQLQAVETSKESVMQVVSYELGEPGGGQGVLRQVRDGVEVSVEEVTVDLFTAAAELARRYHLSSLDVYRLLSQAYPDQRSLPQSHLEDLAQQIEVQTRRYEVRQETVEIALALVKPDGFQQVQADDGTVTYTAEITYPVDREALLARWSEWRERAGEYGFHYDPYNFELEPRAQLLRPAPGRLGADSG